MDSTVEIFKFEEQQRSLVYLKTIKHELLKRYGIILHFYLFCASAVCFVFLVQQAVLLLLFFFIFLEANYFTILYWFCHTLTWIHHRCTCIPHPECPSHLPPHPIPLGHPSAPAPSTLYHAWNLDWWSVSHMIIYMFQWHSPKSSHPCPLPRVQKTVLHIYVSFAISHTGLSLPSF